MTVYFLDSSALVKRYVPEFGTTWIQALADPDANNQLITIAQIIGLPNDNPNNFP